MVLAKHSAVRTESNHWKVAITDTYEICWWIGYGYVQDIGTNDGLQLERRRFATSRT